MHQHFIQEAPVQIYSGKDFLFAIFFMFWAMFCMSIGHLSFSRWGKEWSRRFSK